MNNTKWREIFKFISDNELKFRIWFNSESKYFNNEKLWNITFKDIGDKGINDPGFCGPFYFSSINRLTIVGKYEMIDNLRELSQQKKLIMQDLVKLETWMSRDGKWPYVVTDDGIEIIG